MKKKHLFLVPLLALSCNSSAIAQNVHPTLKNTASKINLAGEHVSMTKLDDDISTITEYLEIILKTVRKNGAKVPSELNAKDLMNILGLNTIKASGSSATKTDNAWLNHAYLDNGGSDKGIFSIFGKPNQEFIAPKIFPAGSDLVFQIQLNLQKLSPMIKNLAQISGEKKITSNMDKNIPMLEMTPDQLLSKMQFTINLAIDINTDKNAQTNPLALASGANTIVRIDGLNWLWEKVGDQLIKQAGAPLIKSEVNGIITYSVPKKMRSSMMGYSPQLTIDKVNNHIWISSKPDFLEECRNAKNPLADSPEFEVAMEKLPVNGNCMMYLSKSMLRTMKSQYDGAAETGLFGKDYEKAKELIDKLVQDITKSDKGWAFVLTKDQTGVRFSNRGPLALYHSKVLLPISALGGAGLFTYQENNKVYINSDNNQNASPVRVIRSSHKKKRPKK